MSPLINDAMHIIQQILLFSTKYKKHLTHYRVMCLQVWSYVYVPANFKIYLIYIK